MNAPTPWPEGQMPPLWPPALAHRCTPATPTSLPGVLGSSGKVPDKWNYTSLIPDVFAAFVVTVVGGMNERCAMILSNQISFDQLQKESMRIAGILQRYTFREIWPYSTWKLACRIVIGWLAVTVVGRTINDKCFRPASLTSSAVPLLLLYNHFQVSLRGGRIPFQ